MANGAQNTEDKIIDKTLTSQDLNLWILSKALMSDKQKYQQGLDLLDKAKNKKHSAWNFPVGYFFNKNAMKISSKAALTLEEALGRIIAHYPYVDQEIFALVENELRERGFTIGYKFQDGIFWPGDLSLEDDLERLANPDSIIVREKEGYAKFCLGLCHGPIAMVRDKNKFMSEVMFGVRTGRSDYSLDFYLKNCPLTSFEEHHLQYNSLIFVEIARRAEIQLQQKLDDFVDILSNKINYWGKLASDNPKKLNSLVRASQLGKDWYKKREAMASSS